ncbi:MULTISPECIES: hypothetical protein [unclassified Beijerinckia]|uniref:hypothetical protein n=1 Tax=unclassified Beijerinckia TaxID=2638183 RepID=UPI00089470A9|nr:MULTISPECIES: hypothetical protein [unclassified Beijerinckia]MDH7797866.1 hypothetical protein [Beijerinckia sp. GAS462]SED01103.1 hypothetical protein SAMN05443249_4158 [Beijerinckia sp. 28-YEA-48]
MSEAAQRHPSSYGGAIKEEPVVRKVISAQEADEFTTTIAVAIETVPPERQVLFLVRLAVILAQLVGDKAKIAEAIRLARRE